MNAILQDIKELIDNNKLIKSQDYKFNMDRSIIYIQTERLFAEFPDRNADKQFVDLKNSGVFLGMNFYTTFRDVNGKRVTTFAIILNAHFLSTSPCKGTTLYCDKDSRGRYGIMDMTKEEVETIRRALTAYRVGMIQNDILPGLTKDSELREQYERAGKIAHLIEETL